MFPPNPQHWSCRVMFQCQQKHTGGFQQNRNLDRAQCPFKHVARRCPNGAGASLSLIRMHWATLGMGARQQLCTRAPHREHLAQQCRCSTCTSPLRTISFMRCFPAAGTGRSPASGTNFNRRRVRQERRTAQRYYEVMIFMAMNRATFICIFTVIASGATATGASLGWHNLVRAWARPASFAAAGKTTLRNDAVWSIGCLVEKWFDQRLDHFSFPRNASAVPTFRQRYFVCDKFWR